MGPEKKGMDPSWPRNIQTARKVQESLRKNVRIAPLRRVPRTLAAVDASYAKGRAIAAVCLYTWPDLVHIEDAVAEVRCPFPYIPGYLSFREGPAAMKAIEKLTKKPDILLFDGQGIAHPRGMGIASHLGVLLGIPSVGCAKSRLVGEFEEPRPQKGSMSKLILKNNVIGVVLRSRTNVRPVFVSPGHLIDITGAVDIVLSSLGRFRLPEPLRRAHFLAQERKNML